MTPAEIARDYFKSRPNRVAKFNNFSGAGVAARPGFQFVPFKFSFTVANAVAAPAANKKLALSAGRHGTAAALAAGSFPTDAVMGDGAVITDFTITADDSNLNCDFFANYFKDRRLYVERLELNSDAPAQFTRTIVVAASTPGNVEKKRTIRIQPYFSVNQNSTNQVDMVLGTKGEEFWIGPDHVAVLDVEKTSQLVIIMSGMMEIPA